MLIFYPAQRTLHLVSTGVEIRDWQMAVEADGALRRSADAQLEIVQREPLQWRWSWSEIGLVWECRATRAGEATLIESRLENRGATPLALGAVYLLDTTTPLHLGDPGGIVGLPLKGELGPRLVYPLDHADCPHVSKVKWQFYNRATGRALQVGFVTFQRADTNVSHSYNPADGITALRAWCDFAGWQLAPGASTPVETFIVAAGDDPYRQLEHWAELAAPRAGARRWEDAPIGWVGWAWVDPFTVERYEEVLLRNLQAVRRRLPGFGVNYVWLSIGNLKDGNPGDWLNWNDELFPHGPAYLAARLRELGFRWGLWCAPFWLVSWLEEQVAAFHDALLKNPDGSPMVVRPEWQFGKAGETPKAQRPCMYALDPSHPKTLAFLRETFAAYRRWGVRYYMIDFLHAGAGNVSSFPYASHYDKTLVAGPEVYHTALRVIREAAGDDTYFLSSTGPSIHNAGALDAIRTGSDFGEGRALYPDSYFYPATFVINSGAFWTGPAVALQNAATAYYTHRRLYINDSGNVLTVDKPLPLEAARLHATIHALSGGPSMIGDDVDRMAEERLALIKKTLPRPRDVAVPLDLWDAVHPAHPHVFHRKVLKPWGRFDVVAVYNFGDELLREEVALSRLGLPDDTPYLVWEFWNEEYVGRARGALRAVVPPGTVRVYRLVADRGHPVLLGSDMHVTMGEMEVDECRWDAATRTLSGHAVRPAGESGSIYIHAPEGVHVTNPRGYWIAKDARDHSLIIRAALAFPEGEATWRISFAPTGAALDVSKVEA